MSELIEKKLRNYKNLRNINEVLKKMDKENKTMNNKNVIIIGGDLTNNGGIASVIKSYYKAYQQLQPDFNLYLLKTYYYKDKSFIYEILILIEALFKFLYFLLFKKISILHIHSSADISFFRKSIFVCLGFIFRKKIIIHLHSSRFDDFFMTSNKIIKTYQKFIFSLSDVVIVLCKDWENKLKSRFPQLRILRVVNPTNLDDSQNLPKTKTDSLFKILFVGFFIESKGIKDLLKLINNFKEQGITGIKFLIAGKGELEEYILNYIAEKKINDYVEYLGWISGKHKTTAFISADALVLPSYKEGMPISILEAMSFGLPIISTTIAGIPDVIVEGRNGFLFTPGAIEELSKIVLSLRNDKNLCEKIKENNLIDISQYSETNVFNEIITLYNKL